LRPRAGNLRQEGSHHCDDGVIFTVIVPSLPPRQKKH
jgi:hypothetical protein